MSKQIIFVDFDRTLFDTKHFMRAFWAAVVAKYHLDNAKVKNDIPRFYRALGELRYYKLDDHLQAALGRPADEIIAEVRPALAAENFYFDDSLSILELATPAREVRILTFGETWYQRVKLTFVPELQDVPIDIILEPKGGFIARQFPGVTGLMIDDKRNPNLPDDITEVWLDRRGHGGIRREDGVTVVNSLNQIQEVV